VLKRSYLRFHTGRITVTAICDEKLGLLYRQTSDPQYYLTLCERHRPRLMGFLQANIHGRPDLDYDAIISEVFEQLHDFLTGANPLNRIAPWLTTSARRHAYATIRWLGRAKRGDGRIMRAGQGSHGAPRHGGSTSDYGHAYHDVHADRDAKLVDPKQEDAVSQAIRAEHVQLLHQAIDGLPTQEHKIVLCKLQGMSDEATAQELTIPLGTVKSAYHLARNTLYTLLSEKIFPES
jgi:RNA polymerase sigma factor (sigma-70 family)